MTLPVMTKADIADKSCKNDRFKFKTEEVAKNDQKL